MFRSAVLASVLLVGSPIPGLAQGEDQPGGSSPAAAEGSDEAETRDAATGLWAAAYAGDVEAIERQLDAGADVNARHPVSGATPLIVAAVHGRVDAVRVLLDRGADVNARGDDKGTALISAAFVGRTEIVELLIERGAKINLRNKDESTALDAAREAEKRLAKVNRQFKKKGKPTLAFGLSLHVGDVMYGNIAVPERLEFSVIGPAANRWRA